MRRTSASWVLPSWVRTVTPPSWRSTDSNIVLVRKVILRLRKARSSCLEIASSSLGTRWGSPSMMVTWLPMEAQAEANSTPMTPPPRITAEAGTWSISRASSEVMTPPEISCPMVLE